MSLCLFFAIIFLIKPEKAPNSHMRRPYVVSFISIDHKNKTKSTEDKNMTMPKLSRSPEPTSIKARTLRKVTRKKHSMHLPNISPINFSNTGREKISGLDFGEEEQYHSSYSGKVQFNQVEGKYTHPHQGKTPPPERFRITGGREIDRIGNTCFEVRSVGGSGNIDTGQTAIEKDVDQSFAMNSLTAHQVPCGKTNGSLAQDFLKQLKKRGLIMAPASKTH